MRGRGRRGFRTAVLLALALGVAFVPVLFFRYVVQYAAQNRADTLEREQILQDLLRLSLTDLKKKNLGHYVQLVSRDVEKAGGLAFYDGISFVGNLALAACMLGYMLKTDWLLSLLIVVTYPLFALATKRMVPRVERAEEAVIEAEEKLNTRPTNSTRAARRSARRARRRSSASVRRPGCPASFALQSATTGWTTATTCCA